MCHQMNLQGLKMRDIREKGAATSMLQTAEWGKLGLQASYPCSKDWFVYEERGEQRITLKMFVLLFNFCSCLVGINQICYVCMTFLNRMQMQNILYKIIYYYLLFIHCCYCCLNVCLLSWLFYNCCIIFIMTIFMIFCCNANRS